MTQRARPTTAPVATSNDGRARHPARRPRGSGQGTVTGWMTTGPRVGSSSVACETPCGVITSTAFGTVPGSTWQIDAVPPGAHAELERLRRRGEAACLIGAEPVLPGQHHAEPPARARRAELRLGQRDRNGPVRLGRQD